MSRVYDTKAEAYRAQLTAVSKGNVTMVRPHAGGWRLVPAQRCEVCSRLNEQFVNKCGYCGDLFE